MIEHQRKKAVTELLQQDQPRPSLRDLDQTFIHLSKTAGMHDKTKKIYPISAILGLATAAVGGFTAMPAIALAGLGMTALAAIGRYNTNHTLSNISDYQETLTLMTQDKKAEISYLKKAKASKDPILLSALPTYEAIDHMGDLPEVTAIFKHQRAQSLVKLGILSQEYGRELPLDVAKALTDDVCDLLTNDVENPSASELKQLNKAAKIIDKSYHETGLASHFFVQDVTYETACIFKDIRKNRSLSERHLFETSYDPSDRKKLAYTNHERGLDAVIAHHAELLLGIQHKPKSLWQRLMPRP